MKSLLFPALAALSGISLATATATTVPLTDMPTSVDATSFLSAVWSGQTATPTWATGEYATTLASALYSLETSFVLASDYSSIIQAIWSAAEKDGGEKVTQSLDKSGWAWDAITTNAWYTKNVPDALQTRVAGYDSVWDDTVESVYSEVTAAAATTTGTKNGAPAAKCTGMAVAGVMAGVAAVAAVL